MVEVLFVFCCPCKLPTIEKRLLAAMPAVDMIHLNERELGSIVARTFGSNRSRRSEIDASSGSYCDIYFESCTHPQSQIRPDENQASRTGPWPLPFCLQRQGPSPHTGPCLQS